LDQVPQDRLNRVIAGGTLILLLLNLSVGYPGVVDDLEQYNQVLTGKFDDWHPPIMAHLWRQLWHLAPGPSPIFFAHVIMHWAGFGLVASALALSRKPVIALIVLLSGAAPIFLFYSVHVYKDVSLACALIAFFGLIFWFRAQGRPVPTWVWIVAAVVWSYATLVRANAPFATIPLLIWAIFDKRLRWLQSVGMFIAGVIIAVPLSQAINKNVLQAADSGVMQTLQTFDIAGIARHSGDKSAWQAVMDTEQPLEACYTPIFWDTFRTPRCDNAWSRLPPPGSADRSEIGDVWRKSIIDHPGAYAIHRFKNFNAATAFLVPTAFQCLAAPEMHDCARRADGTVDEAAYERIILLEFVKKNPTTWPILWLALGVSVLFMSRRLSSEPPIVAGQFVLVSGLVYAFGYSVVGVAADPRYFYWSIMAIQIGSLLALTEARQFWDRKGEVILCGIVLVAIMLGGYAFRLSGNDIFIR
jgi:hypothetical protein